MTFTRERIISGAKTAWPVVAAVIGALASRYAVPFAFRYSMSFLPLAVAVLLFLLYRSQWARVAQASRASLRLAITCAVTALLFSAFLVIGSWSVCEDSGSLSWIHAVAIVANAFPLYVLLVLLMGWLDERAARIQQRTRQPNAFRLRSKGCILVFVVLLLCWLPIFLAAFPGFFCYDMNRLPGDEYAQFVSGNFNADFPTLHVLIMGGLIAFGQNLLGSANAGVALYICVQALVVAAIFTFMVRTIANASGSKGLTVASVIYLGLNPMVSLFVMCTTRDTLFSAFAVLFAALLFTFFRNQSSSSTRKGTNPVPFPTSQPATTSQPEPAPNPAPNPKATSLVALGLAAIMVCFLRPNGIIAFIVLIPFLILFLQGARARLAMGGMCAAVLVACWLWFTPTAGALGVTPGGTARLLMFSLPAQQITKVVENDTYSLTEIEDLLASGYGELDENGEVLMYDRSPQLADDARWNLERMDNGDILRLYLTLGLSHPMEYLEAFIDQTQSAWNPYAYALVYANWEGAGAYEGRSTSLFEFDWQEPVTSESLAPALLSALENISGQLTLQNVPLLALFVTVPFYLWLVILMLMRTIVTLDRRIAAPCILLFALTVTAFFGPAVLMRYYLPLIFGLPLMITLLLCSRRMER